MKNTMSKSIGMKRLIKQYKEKFETEENINYYAYKDFVQAERKYIKFVLDGYCDTNANLSCSPLQKQYL